MPGCAGLLSGLVSRESSRCSDPADAGTIFHQPQGLGKDGQKYPRRHQRQQGWVHQRFPVLPAVLHAKEYPTAADDDPRPGQGAGKYAVMPRGPDEQHRAARPPDESRDYEPTLVIPGLQRVGWNRRWGRCGITGRRTVLIAVASGRVSRPPVIAHSSRNPDAVSGQLRASNTWNSNSPMWRPLLMDAAAYSRHIRANPGYS